MVGDAIDHPGMANNHGNPNPPRKTESGFKRLRSVVVAENADTLPEASGGHYHAKPRLELSRQGSNVPPGIAVALKAAAAAAEDVNKNKSTKGRRLSGTVWDRLGNRDSNVKVKGNVTHEVGTAVANDGEIGGAWDDMEATAGEDVHQGKRPRWRKLSVRPGNGPRDDDETALAADLNFGGVGSRQRNGMTETKQHESVSDRITDIVNMSDEEDQFEDAVAPNVGEYFRFGAMNDSGEGIRGKSSTSPSMLYGLPGRETAVQHGLHHGLMSHLRVVHPLNRMRNIHINANGGFLQSMDFDAPVTLSRRGAYLEQELGLNSAEPDQNDVLEMKKRMRQVQLEMTKLRAKQAEVTKEVHKVSSTAGPGNVNSRSQEEVDLHSVCVANIHFAATKETIAAHFSQCGDVVRVTVVTDIVTGKSKGIAYVEFYSKESVEKALKLNESSLLSRSLKVVRKDVAEASVLSGGAAVSTISHGSPHMPVNPPGKFLRGPVNLRRPTSITRPFPGTAHLQWKREKSSHRTDSNYPVGFRSPSVPRSGRAAAWWSPLSPSLMGSRYRPGPMRLTRSMSYVRPASYRPQESTPTTQEQKVAS